MTQPERLDTVPRIFGAKLAAEADRPFLKYGGTWLTLTELAARTDRVAAGLAALGVLKGQRVAAILPSRQETLETFLACARYGFVHVGVNPFLRDDFLARPLRDSGARVLVTDAEGLVTVAPLLEQTAIEAIVLVGPPPASPAARSFVPYDQLGIGKTAPHVEIDANDLVSIVYTSGTTGLSKGCMLSHGYFSLVMQPYRQLGWIAADDRVITAFGFNHLSGPLSLIVALQTQRVSVCFEPQFSASRFMQRMREESATVIFGVGAMGNAILAQPETSEDREYRHRLAIWIPMAEPAQLEWERRFVSTVVGEGIGQTECTPMTLGRTHKRGSLGMPVNHLEVRVVDAEDREVPAGTVGELAVRSRVPNGMFSGYWNMPEATLTAWRNLWHHTGDLVRADDDGCLHFVDRNKDCIRRRGENISSFEIELAIASHPQIAQAAAIAIRPPEGGEDEVKLCVVPKPGATIDVAQWFEFAKTKLPYYAVPRYLEFRDSLPVTPATGRTQKQKLREEGLTPATVDLFALGLRVERHERRLRA